jgi:hypothetical protein
MYTIRDRPFTYCDTHKQACFAPFWHWQFGFPHTRSMAISVPLMISAVSGIRCAACCLSLSSLDNDFMAPASFLLSYMLSDYNTNSYRMSIPSGNILLNGAWGNPVFVAGLAVANFLNFL